MSLQVQSEHLIVITWKMMEKYDEYEYLKVITLFMNLNLEFESEIEIE